MKKYVLLVVSASLTTPLIAQKINRENLQYASTQGIKSEGKHQVEATAFMLRVLRGEGILGTAISDLEEKVEAENDEVASRNTKAFADIILKGEVIIECKSWVPGGISFNKFIPGESGSYHQFKTYLGSNEVTTLANLQY